MAYYYHESLPWPRRTVEHTNFTTYYEDRDPRVICEGRNIRSNLNVGHPSRWAHWQDTQAPQTAQKCAKTPSHRPDRKTVKEMKNNLLEGISKPVESSKAERMMQMMGWQGGALGKTGAGIREPIAPNLNLQRGAGLGHKTIESKSLNAVQAQAKQNAVQGQAKQNAVQGQAKQNAVQGQAKQNAVQGQAKQNAVQGQAKQSIPSADSTNSVTPAVPATAVDPRYKGLPIPKGRDPEEWLSRYEYVPQKPRVRERIYKYKNKPQLWRKRRNTNSCPIRLEILEDLLTFVRDNRRVEMKYDRTLSDARRKLIHQIVESIRNEDATQNRCKLDHPALLSVFTAVCDCSRYVMQSQSEGEKPLRQLCVYKEAPAHVYLITKEDLEDDDDDERKDDKVNDASNAVLANQKKLIENIERDVKQEDTVDVLKCKEKYNYKAVTIAGKEECINTILSEEVTVKSENIHKVQVKVENGEEEHVAKDPCPSLGTQAVQIKVEKFEDIEPKKETIKLNTEEYIKGLFKEYLKEFFESQEYTEMRFLGEFNVLQQEVLDDFLTNVKQCLEDVVPEGNWLLDIVLDNKYIVLNDNYGGILIVKDNQNRNVMDALRKNK